MKVTRDQFEADGELAVIHIPTGQRYSTYRYERPHEMSEIIGRGMQVETDAEGNDYATDEIQRIAVEILRERLAELNR